MLALSYGRLFNSRSGGHNKLTGGKVVEVIAEAVVAAEVHQEVDVVPHVEVDAAVLVPEVAQRPLLYVDLSASVCC